jgi:hypothetical protein
LRKKTGLVKRFTRDRTFFYTTLLIIALSIFLCLLIVSGKGNAQVNTVQPAVQQGSAYNASRLKNLTAEYIYGKSGEISGIALNLPLKATVSAPAIMAEGSNALVNVTYNGVFNFLIYNSTAYVQNVISIHYIGFYRNGSDGMLVFNNRPNVTSFFQIASQARVYSPSNTNPYNYTAIEFNITPTAKASGIWFFCGGVFMAFKNNSGWGNQFNNLTFLKMDLNNGTVLNLISENCSKVIVR